MTDRIQIVALAVSVLLLLVVLELVRRRKLTEEYSFLWIVFALALVLLSVRRDILDATARWLGVYYPPIVLLLVLILMVFVASLCFSVIVSRQRQQIERLIEETAILAAEVRGTSRRSRPDRAIVRPRSGAARAEQSRVAAPYRPPVVSRSARRPRQPRGSDPPSSAPRAPGSATRIEQARAAPRRDPAGADRRLASSRWLRAAKYSRSR